MSKAIKEKEAKLAWLNKVINALGIFWGQALTVKPAKIVAGLEADQTNMMLQALALGATSGRSSEQAVSAALNGETPSASSAVPATSSSSKEDPGKPSRRNEPSDEGRRREKREPASNREQKESKSEPAEQAAAQERPRRSARPSTARRRPPKLKENVTEKKTKGVAAKPVRGIMTEGGSDDDEEESDEEATPGALGGMDGAMSTLGGDPVDKAQAGKLVRDIMDDEAAMNKKNGMAPKETKLGDGGIRMGKIGRSRRGGKKGRRGGRGDTDERQGSSKTSTGKGLEMSNEELDELRQAIQAISQSTHPLSKCMDFVHDDVALMNEEAEEWNKMYRDKIGSMEAASKDTDEALQALIERREEIRDQIAAEKLKINSVKASIAMNDARIAELLQMVVHTSR